LQRERYSSITAEGDIGTVDAILAQDGLDFFRTEMCQGHSICHIDSAFVLLLERDVWWFLVESNAETFQFGFYYSLVGEWFVDVEDNENQIARPCNSYDLTTSTLKVRNDAQNVQDAYLAVFSTLDDSWQIENLLST
jgi:hypothetical protein